MQSEPVSEPVFIEKIMARNYSTPKLFIPKVNGKPSVAPGKRWYVSFYWRDPETGVLSIKVKRSHGINKFKTVKERKAAGKAIAEAYLTMLKRGYDPLSPDVTNTDLLTEPLNLTIEKAFKETYDTKSLEWAETTRNNNLHRKEKFLEWCRTKNLSGVLVRKFSKRMVSAFLNDLAITGQSSTSVNNYKAFISSIFGKMVEEDLISVNPVKGIKKRLTNPTLNKPFSPEQIIAIKEYLLKNDFYLYCYLRVITYAFVRPIEVVRMKIGNIDRTNKILYVGTKTEKRSTIRIISQLEDTFNDMKILGYPQDAFLFTLDNEPGIWLAKDSSKTDIFNRRFKKLKDAMGFGPEYGMYSFRHTFSLDLYFSLLKDGNTDMEAKLKLITITRHKNIKTLEKYLRNIGGAIPKDYSEVYTIDF